MSMPEDWHPSLPLAVRVWLAFLVSKASPDRLDGIAGAWTGEEDWADPHLPAVLKYADGDCEIEVRIRPAAEYRPTL